MLPERVDILVRPILDLDHVRICEIQPQRPAHRSERLYEAGGISFIAACVDDHPVAVSAQTYLELRKTFIYFWGKKEKDSPVQK